MSEIKITVNPKKLIIWTLALGGVAFLAYGAGAAQAKPKPKQTDFGAFLENLATELTAPHAGKTRGTRPERQSASGSNDASAVDMLAVIFGVPAANAQPGPAAGPQSEAQAVDTIIGAIDAMGADTVASMSGVAGNAGMLTEMAKIQLMNGRNEDSVATFKRALTVNPRYAEAHYNLACAYARMRDTEQALSTLRTAVTLDRKYVTLARGDSDFAEMRQSSEFMAIVK